MTPRPTSAPADSGRAAARALLAAGCVSVRTDEPFRLPSGWASPVYMDCRRLISFPAIRRQLVALSLQALKASDALNGVAAIAGGEASGIALAAWLADALDLPLQYVRKKSTAQRQVEGVVEPGARVLLVDDMMAAGQSKLRFFQALTHAGAKVDHAFVIFDYGTFPTASLLAPMGLTVQSLATWHDVFAVLSETGSFEPAALTELAEFLDHPAQWSEAHGGIAAVASRITGHGRSIDAALTPYF